MKILHIATSTRGGAGIAAFRLHEGLLSCNIDSNFLCMSSNGIADKIHVFDKPYRSFSNRLLNRVNPYSQNSLRSKRRKTLGTDYEIFSYATTDVKVEKSHLIEDADIINLHWIAGLVNYPSFFQTVSKPIVWTMHDMNPFLGGFHYLGDQSRNPQYQRLDEQILKIKEKAYQNSQLKAIVTPSKWLCQASRESFFFREILHEVIPNGLDTTLFRPWPKNLVREILQLPKDKAIVLFLSENINNKRKGFKYVVELSKMADFRNVAFVAVGKEPINRDENIIYLGPIHDKFLLPLVYSASDVFLLPSLEDNLPNVMLESLCCGTPVIGFPVGGIRETIVEGFNGYLASEISINSLRDTLLKFLFNLKSFNAMKISEASRNEFSISKQALKYKQLYDSLS